MKKSLVVLLVLAISAMAFGYDDKKDEKDTNKAEDRVEAAGTVLDEIESAPDTGIPEEVLLDNARALVSQHDVHTRTVTFNPKFLAFARHWGFRPRACAPYRARTKGKDESGVGYVKRNAIAGHSFDTPAPVGPDGPPLEKFQIRRIDRLSMRDGQEREKEKFIRVHSCAFVAKRFLRLLSNSAIALHSRMQSANCSGYND